MGCCLRLTAGDGAGLALYVCALLRAIVDYQSWENRKGVVEFMVAGKEGRLNVLMIGVCGEEDTHSRLRSIVCSD